MVNVQVLLSTFNGEKFLREQMESLLRQTDVNLHILIRDDGSTDLTRQIISEYELLPNVNIILGQNIGVISSFFELIKASDENCEYFAFCDQDDIWLDHKLQRSIEVLQQQDNAIPLLYTSCLNIVNESLQYIDKYTMPPKATSFYNAMIQNVSTGNTQVFNRYLRNLLTIPIEYNNIVMHDHFCYLLACAFGKTIFDDASNILYRQHLHNQIGMKNNFIELTRTRIKTVLTGKTKAIAHQIKFFLDLYESQIQDEYKNEICRFLDSNNIFKRIKYVLTKKAYCQKTFSSFAFWTLYLFGFYKI